MTNDAEMPDDDTVAKMAKAYHEKVVTGEFTYRECMKAALSCDAYRVWLQEKKNAAFKEGYEKGVINDF